MPQCALGVIPSVKCARLTWDTCGGEGPPTAQSRTVTGLPTPDRHPTARLQERCPSLLVISILALQETRTEITPQSRKEGPTPANVRDETGRGQNRQTGGWFPAQTYEPGGHWLSQEGPPCWSKPAQPPWLWPWPLGPLPAALCPAPSQPPGSAGCRMRPKLQKQAACVPSPCVPGTQQEAPRNLRGRREPQNVRAFSVDEASGLARVEHCVEIAFRPYRSENNTLAGPWKPAGSPRHTSCPREP